MKEWRRSIRIAPMFWLFSCLILFVALVYPHTAVSENKAVARVNGVLLTDTDLEGAYNEILPAAVFHGGITPDKKLKYREQAVNLMINGELLYQEALSRGMKPDEGYVDKKVQQKIERLGGENVFESALKQWGITRDKYRRIIEREYLVRAIRDVFKDEANVTKDEVRKYYEQNKDGYVRPEQFRIRHILLKLGPNDTQEEMDLKRSEAQKIIEKARKGEDFAALAWDYSEDPYRVKGGDLGVIHQGMLDPELESEVEKLKVGEVSDVIETIYGYHIVKMEERSPERQLTFDEVAGRIESKMKEERAKKIEKDVLKRLRKESDIEIY